MTKLSISQEKLELLMRLTAHINSKSNIEAILLAIMDASKTIMEAEASSLLLVDDETNELVLTTPTGPATAELSNKRFPPGYGIAGWVVKNNQTAIVTDVQNDKRFGGDIRKDLFKTENVICVPLRNSEEKVIGAVQAINTPIIHKDVETNLLFFEALANQAAIAISNAQLRKEKIQRELFEQELDLARKIQSEFWPSYKETVQDYTLFGTSRPARHAGGDYFDIFAIPNTNKYGFVVADVSGKGVAAALLMATVRAIIRAYSEVGLSPEVLTNMVNNAIHRDTPFDKFITMFYGVLDFDTNEFTFVNAGHNPPYLLAADGKTLTPLTEGGLMLGVMKSVPYVADKLTINPGEKIILFTDGITEAQNEKEEFFEDEGLENWLKTHSFDNAKDLVEELFSDVTDFHGTAPQFDDMTLVAIARN